MRLILKSIVFLILTIGMVGGVFFGLMLMVCGGNGVGALIIWGLSIGIWVYAMRKLFWARHDAKNRHGGESLDARHRLVPKVLIPAVDFIERARKNGDFDEEISRDLLDAGWKDDDIDSAFQLSLKQSLFLARTCPAQSKRS